jgi:hypothetical protein
MDQLVNFGNDQTLAARVSDALGFKTEARRKTEFKN